MTIDLATGKRVRRVKEPRQTSDAGRDSLQEPGEPSENEATLPCDRLTKSRPTWTSNKRTR